MLNVEWAQAISYQPSVIIGICVKLWLEKEFRSQESEFRMPTQ